MQYEPLIEEVCSDEEEERRLAPALVSVPTAPAHPAAPAPAVSINHSSNVHVGTVVNVTPPTETVKVKFLCLNLETVKRAKKLRCGIATCLCWMVLISCGLTAFSIVYSANYRTRIDIDLNETWYVRRFDWMSQNINVQEFLNLPVPYVVIMQTDHAYCDSKINCKDLVRAMQSREWSGNYGDIVPNFLIGGGGVVLEGRGANVVGYLLPAIKHSMITISFIGDYGRDTPDEAQFTHMALLLEVLVADGVLTTDYQLLGYCQKVSHVANPGYKVMRELHRFSHWIPDNANKCEPGRFWPIAHDGINFANETSN